MQKLFPQLNRHCIYFPLEGNLTEILSRGSKDTFSDPKHMQGKLLPSIRFFSERENERDTQGHTEDFCKRHVQIRNRENKFY